MSIRYEHFDAADADVYLILPGDEYDSDVMPDGLAGLAIGDEASAGLVYAVLTGTPAQLRTLADRILETVDALRRAQVTAFHDGLTGREASS